ncbi:MAG: ATP-binding cassette domain-containing protein [Candidatus Marinimicrobia bacterium]|jgi:ABC-2 type transport system ATP-binding protein|nr:ATP-binding cassette domain-containing protein [Candidatus Neomarinimicrobiota bacterium]MDP6852725.1 ATP-binding cassette domain-containing protein [Candidatus Neomarinimicrobiota bacterium]MDP6935863.1 ATP-binding cassette domain-containing protein [Candidatus Neomarinimicrobiota bacterium]
MIRVDNLSKSYDEVKAVKSINFELNDGEIVGFLGANGAGKSTTLKVMTGYLSPTRGNVHVNDLNILDNTHAIQKQIGYLPELNPLYGEMRVYDLLEFTGNIRNVTGKAFKTALARVIDQCGLKGVIHKSVSECSKGYKQRIGLACAMIHDPKILILDEPVTGLDPNQIVEIRNLIKDLGTEKLVLMSSHILQEIQATVNRIIIIHKGEIVADGTNEELMSGFRGNTKLTLEVKNAEDESIKGLTEKIPSLSLLDAEVKNGSQLLQLEYPKDQDPREALFKYAVDSNWVVTEMSPHSANLESIFRTLTMEDSAIA